MSPSPPQALPKPTEQIARTLQADMVDVFIEHVPVLRDLSREAAYDAVMGDPELLARCFHLFRTQPGLFSTVVVNAYNQPVTEDDDGLKCGRTLGEAVTLVVRASARRYFRQKLGQTRRVMVHTKRQPGFLGQLAILLGVARPPRPVPRKVVGGGDRLFNAMREYLRFDWQAGLIPHYTPLSPEMVTQLGPRLMDIREPSELRALTAREEHSGLSEGRMPLLLDSAKRLIKPSGDTLDSELLYKVCNQMDLARLFPGRDANAMRRAIAQVAGTDAGAIDQIMPILGGDLRLFVSFFFVAYVVLGEDEYRQCFGEGGANQWMVPRFVERLSQLEELPPPSFDALRKVFATILSARHGH